MLAGLISQWVHRYGFDGAAELDLSLPEPSASKHGFSSAPIPVAEEEIAPEDEISPEDDVLVENEVVAEDEVVGQDEVVVEEEEQIAAEDDVLIESEVMPNGWSLKKNRSSKRTRVQLKKSRFNAALHRHLCLPRRSARPFAAALASPPGG